MPGAGQWSASGGIYQQTQTNPYATEAVTLRNPVGTYLAGDFRATARVRLDAGQDALAGLTSKVVVTTDKVQPGNHAKSAQSAQSA